MGEARFQTDFYRCPNTGEWVYRWKDERTVVIDSADLRALKESQAEVVRLREALTAAETAVDELAAEAEEWETENVRLREALSAAEAEIEELRFQNETIARMRRDVIDGSEAAENARLREALAALTAAATVLRKLMAHDDFLGIIKDSIDVTDAEYDALLAAASDGEARR